MNQKIGAFVRRWPFVVWVVLGLAAIYGLWFVVASPVGEFPLNDDWAYAQSVRHLLDTGQLRISQWAAATVVFQTYWGALFAQLLGGFSFTALRYSTLFFSFCSGLAFYLLLRQLELSERTAAVGALGLIANPLFMYLSYTFMSDIFFLGLMLLSLAFYTRGIQKPSAPSLLAGSLCAAGAYLSRQLGVALPVVAIIALILKERRLAWKSILLAGLIPFGTIAIHTVWLQWFHGLPWGLTFNAFQNSARLMLSPYAPLILAQRLLLSLLYLGLFTLPVTVAFCFNASLPKPRLIRLGKIFGIWCVALGVFVLLQVFLTGRPMPYLSGLISLNGLGVLSLLGTKTPVTPIWIFWLMTVVAPFAGAAQATLWTDALFGLRRELRSPGLTFILASLFIAIPTAIIVILWDEYLLVFVPLGLYLGLRLNPIQRRGAVAAFAVCAAFMAYSLVELRDNFAWNTARWQAGRALMAQGVRPEAIDGYLEWEGWYEFESTFPQAIAAGKGNDLWAWMYITPHDYWLSFQPVAGYTVVTQTPYPLPWNNGVNYVYTLKLTPP